MQAQCLGLGGRDLKKQKLSGFEQAVPGTLPPAPQVLGTVRVPPPPAGAMVCGDFACSKNALCALNVVYMVRFGRWGGQLLGGEARGGRSCCRGTSGGHRGYAGRSWKMPGRFRRRGNS